MAVPVFQKEALYVPMKFVSAEELEAVSQRFEKSFYKKEKVCEACDYFADRPSEVCDSCMNYSGKYKMWRQVERNGKMYLRLPFGSIRDTARVFGELQLINKNEVIPMRRKPNFLRELKDYQEAITPAIRRDKNGLIVAKARTGKTVMGSHFICTAGLKTVIMAGQRDWLENFYETFVGSDTEEPFTDINKKRIGFAKKLEDFEKYDVCLVTYQTFLSEGGKVLLRQVKNMFSVLMVDEVQGVGAKEFSIIVNQFACMYKIGLSATPERKDEKEWILFKLIGPVIHKVITETLRPEVRITRTAFAGPVPQSWTYMVSKLEKDPKRLMLIAQQAIKDVDQGHMVLIPLTRVESIRALSMAINKLRGKRIARPFYGGMKKEERKLTIDKCRNYICKVLVGQMRLISTGINIPRASCLYEVSPSANMPKAQQRFSRVLTKYDGKPQPIIRYFLDNIDVRKTCMRVEFFSVLKPLFRPIISENTAAALMDYMSKKKNANFHHHDGTF